MKHIQFLFVLALALSCAPGTENEFGEEFDNEVASTRLAELSLAPYGMDIILGIPEELMSKVEVRRNENFGRIEVSAGASVSFFVTTDFESLQSLKRDLEAGIFKIEYVEDRPDFILYRATLPDGSSPYYNFVKTVAYNGEVHVIENNPLMEFSEDDIRLMAGIAESVQPTVINGD